MKKVKITFLFVLFFMASCAAPKKETKIVKPGEKVEKAYKLPSELNRPSYSFATPYKIKKVEVEKLELIESEEKAKLVRAGILLPLSGRQSEIGESMKNAALLSYFASKSDNLILQFYDTKGSETGASSAIREALSEDTDVIVGPLFSNSVDTVANYAGGRLPVISFTTDPAVLGDGVYSIGLSLQQQVERILKYSFDQGIFKFAILAPDNSAGKNIAAAAYQMSDILGIDVSNIGYFDPDNPKTFEATVKRISDYHSRMKLRNKALSQLKTFFKGDYEEGDLSINYSASISSEIVGLLFEDLDYLARGEEQEISASKLLTYKSATALKEKLEELDKAKTLGEPPFDAVIIAAGGNNLALLSSLLEFHDVRSKDIKYLGTNLWEGDTIYKERSLRGGWYTALPNNYETYFIRSYKDVYNKMPHDLAPLAYDVISLLSLAASDGEVARSEILNPNGYVGINGAFRILSSGIAERALEVKQVKSRSSYVIDPAPTSFRSSFYNQF